ncbi:myelin-associated glycoprotein [Denticeps clupeoides]|uniref:myelin-associated glycoprotein n=1 Tax=Denticeps clupeoides TaxID=299321 RepID=UPI0010A599E1|nr:myelin-associated glycoprotein-like [Denticeps clupeoides]
METFLLLTCALLICVKGTRPETSWSAEIPETVSGLLGSCIVIPCSFTYPTHNLKTSEIIAIWHTDSRENIYHPEKSKVDAKYKGRTRLLGDLSHRNCSLKIEPLKRSDKGPYTFRVEIEDKDKYSFKNSRVSITIKDAPESPVLLAKEEVQSGEVAQATCSVSHSCPANPPIITWSHSGATVTHSEHLTNGEWRMTSSLTFTPTRADHKVRLYCTASYSGGKKVRTYQTLLVKYAPEDVRVESVPEVREGESALLNCSSDSNPPAYSYQWYNVNGILQSEGHSFTQEKVSRSTQPLYCTAINTEGQGSSRPAVLNVVYVPEIKAGSGCTTEISTVTCLCMVDAHPSSEIQWLLPDPFRALPSTSVENHGSLTIVTLQGAPGFADSVQCLARNSQGNSTMMFNVPHNGMTIVSALL